MSGQTIDYAALAKQAGAVSSTPAASGIDYAALAKQAGAISSTPAQTGTQKMVSPTGQVIYASPDQVQGLQASGHTLIQPNGNYRVMPMPGEDFTDVAKRAAAVRSALGAQGQAQAEKAELSTNLKNLKSPNPLKNPLVAAPIAGAAGAAGIAGAGEAGAALFGPSAVPTAGGMGFGGEAAGTVAGPSVASQVAGRLGSVAVKYGIKALATGGATAAGFALYNELKKIFEQ